MKIQILKYSVTRWMVTGVAAFGLFAVSKPADAGEVAFDVRPAERHGPSLLGDQGAVSLRGDYASTYYFRGLDFGDNLLSGRLDIDVVLGAAAVFSVGGRYLTTDDSYEESQFYAAFQQGLGVVSVGVGYRYYGLDASADDNRHEIGAVIGSRLAGVDFSASFFHDTGLNGQYLELLAAREWVLTDPVSLRTSLSVSAARDYWVDGTTFNNSQFEVELPVSLNPVFTFTPYVGVNVPLHDLRDVSEDGVYGGFAATLDF